VAGQELICESMECADFVLGNTLIKVKFPVLRKRVGNNMTALNYQIGDFLIRLKNAAQARKKRVQGSNTKMINSLCSLLCDLGYISEIEKSGEKLVVCLRYEKKDPMLMDIKLISKPGLRVYMSASEIKNRKGPSVLIISTSKGLLSSYDAIKKNIGGEALAEVL